MIKVLMVCLGNICRSPTAEVVFRQKVAEHKLENLITIDSAGTGDWHIGHSPDDRATSAAAKRDLDLSPLRARLVESADFETFDYVFAMDKENLKNLSKMTSPQNDSVLNLFLTYPNEALTQGYDEVPDPYYSGDEGFELVLDLIEEASEKIVNAIIVEHGLNSSKTASMDKL
jgi:protein-tyrosine phosphatase